MSLSYFNTMNFSCKYPFCSFKHFQYVGCLFSECCNHDSIWSGWVLHVQRIHTFCCMCDIGLLFLGLVVAMPTVGILPRSQRSQLRDSCGYHPQSFLHEHLPQLGKGSSPEVCTLSHPITLHNNNEASSLHAAS